MTAVVEKLFYVCFLVNLNFISVAEFDVVCLKAGTYLEVEILNYGNLKCHANVCLHKHYKYICLLCQMVSRSIVYLQWFDFYSLQCNEIVHF